MLPFVGRFNWPISMLTWDVIVLNGYLIINLHICGYLLYVLFLGEKPNPIWYVPFVFLSIVWAISIHTVTAFLYCGLGGRPLWNSAVLAPRFLASAFVSGPAFILLTMMILERVAGVVVGRGPRATLVGIIRVTCILNLFLLACEVFTEFYTGGSHTSSARYLLLGLGDANALVPWIWSAIAFNVIAAAMFLCPATARHDAMLAIACILTTCGIWIEKGMGLIVPGFVPSTLHEVVEYLPSVVEWKITLGIWAGALIIYTLSIKLAVAVMTDRLHLLSSNKSTRP
jgi:molybdopterin-containing oxidoreductase family membrane subunit